MLSWYILFILIIYFTSLLQNGLNQFAATLSLCALEEDVTLDSKPYNSKAGPVYHYKQERPHQFGAVCSNRVEAIIHGLRQCTDDHLMAANAIMLSWLRLTCPAPSTLSPDWLCYGHGMDPSSHLGTMTSDL